MFHTVTALEGMSVHATDGSIGSVKDTYFDDQTWTLRYLVVDTLRWLPSRDVLITPISIQHIDWRGHIVQLDLTRDQVERSPSVDWDEPATRRQEQAYLDHFAYPYYWSGPLRWGSVPFPPSSRNAMQNGPDLWWEQQGRTSDEAGDPCLRSTEAVSGYHIEASDGWIGQVQDFLFDPQDWSLRFLAIDTRNGWPGRHVLVAIDWIELVSWSERKAHVSMTQDAIKRAAEWHPELALVAQDEDYLRDRDNQKHAARRRLFH